MKITSGDTLSRVTRQFEITEDHPVIGMAYSRAPKKVRIHGGVITYAWSEGSWVVRSEYAVNLSGTVLKQDGTDSKNDHTRHPDSKRGSYMNGRLVLADEFAWLQPVIDLLRPTGELSTLTLEGTKVTP